MFASSSTIVSVLVNFYYYTVLVCLLIIWVTLNKKYKGRLSE